MIRTVADGLGKLSAIFLYPYSQLKLSRKSEYDVLIVTSRHTALSSEMFADIVSYGATEESYKEGHCAEDSPNHNMAVFVVFDAIQGECREGGEAAAEACHCQ